MDAKTILVTGGSIGIGREDALAFAKEGHNIALTYYKDKEEAQQVVDLCLKEGATDAVSVYLNLMDSVSIRDAVSLVVRRFGRISVLINNAGVVIWKPLAEQTIEEIEIQIRTNLEGMIKLTKECLPYIDEAIVNVSSRAGLDGYENITAYCASKWGVRGFTKALAEELPELDIYAVNPGATATRMTGFEGIHPKKVSEVILTLTKGGYKLESGADVNITDYAT